ncbi:putative ankyrin repeat protein RF_0381 [Leptopilina boulardi]|uniref:putative ankyrin repeat protein RF_0381 n=1 Tax=Leptopilina boulardi TaxID=63433 RepID=UPI0021F539C8|nr:putative ankyrin repeat protein RF_0381 [Leptopilina boulardi]XP_051167875.1 putative ankyrin repeat protein RF_0381 [Leptopilina boulardi]
MDNKKIIKSKVDDTYTQQRIPLLDFGEGINLQDRRGETQLHKELKAGIFRIGKKTKYAFETTKLLLEHGADMNICGREGTTPLQEALLSGISEAVETFIPKEDQLLNCKNCKNIIRCRYLIKFFLDQDKHLNVNHSNYSTLLHFAALNGDNESFNEILQNSNANLNAFNAKGMTLLHITTLHEMNDMIELLIKHGADSNLQIQLDQAHQNLTNRIGGFTSLHLAVSKGYLKIVETLVKNGANVNATSPYGNPIHIACDTFYFPSINKLQRVRNAKIAEILIENNAKIEAQDAAKKTPLQRACDNKYEEMVEVLLKVGASFKMKFHQRRSALHYIVGINNTRIMKLFLDQGLDPNVKDFREETPLIYGSKSSAKGISLDIIELLIEYGADIDAGDINGVTALHIAAGFYNLKVVKYLLKLGANVNIRTKNDLTPLDRILIKFRGCKITRKNTAFKTLECLCAYTALSIHMGEKNLNFNMIKGQMAVDEFYQQCEQQIDLMKKEQICSNSTISYFDLLNVNVEKLILFLRNNDLMDALIAKKYWDIPIYGDLLKDRVKKGKLRKDLIESNTLILKQITKRQLPYFVNDMIFNCLSLKDLRNFNQAFRTK